MLIANESATYNRSLRLDCSYGDRWLLPPVLVATPGEVALASVAGCYQPCHVLVASHVASGRSGASLCRVRRRLRDGGNRMVVGGRWRSTFVLGLVGSRRLPGRNGHHCTWATPMIVRSRNS